MEGSCEKEGDHESRSHRKAKKTKKDIHCDLDSLFIDRLFYSVSPSILILPFPGFLSLLSSSISDSLLVIVTIFKRLDPLWLTIFFYSCCFEIPWLARRIFLPRICWGHWSLPNVISSFILFDSNINLDIFMSTVTLFRLFIHVLIL